MRGFFLVAALLLGGAWLSADPVVDGKVGAGEYAHSQTVLGGGATLSWSQGGDGGLSMALVAKTKGWAAVGLGARRMSGATFYLGFGTSDGTGVFSEQKARGHSHSDSGAKAVDASVVSRTAGVTVLEFHLKAGQLPFTGSSVPFIAALGPTADLVSFHGDSFDTGTLLLP